MCRNSPPCCCETRCSASKIWVERYRKQICSAVERSIGRTREPEWNHQTRIVIIILHNVSTITASRVVDCQRIVVSKIINNSELHNFVTIDRYAVFLPSAYRLIIFLFQTMSHRKWKTDSSDNLAGNLATSRFHSKNLYRLLSHHNYRLQSLLTELMLLL